MYGTAFRGLSKIRVDELDRQADDLDNRYARIVGVNVFVQEYRSVSSIILHEQWRTLLNCRQAGSTNPTIIGERGAEKQNRAVVPRFLTHWSPDMISSSYVHDATTPNAASES